MKRRFALAASTLSIAALLAVAAAPAAAQPHGKGLESFGTATCEGIGEVSVFGPRGEKAASSFTTSGLHAVLVSITVTGTFEGEPFEFSKTYGRKSGHPHTTCTQHLEEDGVVADVTVVVAIVRHSP